MKTENEVLLEDARRHISRLSMVEAEDLLQAVIGSPALNLAEGSEAFDVAQAKMIACCERKLTLQGIDPKTGVDLDFDPYIEAEKLEANYRAVDDHESADLVRAGIDEDKGRAAKTRKHAESAEKANAEWRAKDDTSRQLTKIERASAQSRGEYENFVKLGIREKDASEMAGWSPPDLNPGKTAEELLAE